MRIYTKQQLIKKLGISHTTLWDWEKKGIIPMPKLPVKMKIYGEDEVDTIINSIRQYAKENKKAQQIVKRLDE